MHRRTGAPPPARAAAASPAPGLAPAVALHLACLTPPSCLLASFAERWQVQPARGLPGGESRGCLGTRGSCALLLGGASRPPVGPSTHPPPLHRPPCPCSSASTSKRWRWGPGAPSSCAWCTTPRPWSRAAGCRRRTATITHPSYQRPAWQRPSGSAQRRTCASWAPPSAARWVHWQVPLSSGCCAPLPLLLPSS